MDKRFQQNVLVTTFCIVLKMSALYVLQQHFQLVMVLAELVKWFLKEYFLIEFSWLNN